MMLSIYSSNVTKKRAAQSPVGPRAAFSIHEAKMGSAVAAAPAVDATLDALLVVGVKRRIVVLQLASSPDRMWLAKLSSVEVDGVEIGFAPGTASRGVMDANAQPLAERIVFARLDDHRMPHLIQLIRRGDDVSPVEGGDGQELHQFQEVFFCHLLGKPVGARVVLNRSVASEILHCIEKSRWAERLAGKGSGDLNLKSLHGKLPRT